MAIKPYPQYIEAEDAADIDAELLINRNDTCVIQRKAGTRSVGGAPVETYATLSTVACQVAAAGRAAVERMFGGRVGPETDYVIKLFRDDVVPSDGRIVVNGKTLQVVSDDAAKSNGFELIVAAKATS